MPREKLQLGDVLRLDIHAVDLNPNDSYSMAGVYSFGRGLFSRGPLLGSETTYKRFHKLQLGQVVLSQLKGWEGAIAIVGPAHDGKFLSPQFPTFTCEQSVNADYIGWYLRYPYVWEKLRQKARGMGARRDTITPAEFLSLEIDLPPLPDQQRIAEKLDKVQRLVDERRLSARLIEDDIQAFLVKIFGEITKQSPRRLMREVAPLVRRSVEIDSNISYPELGVRSFGRGTFHKPNLAGTDVGSKNLFRIESGDLVFNIVFAWEGAVAIAQKADHGRFGSHRFLTCVPDQSLASAAFLRFFFLSREGIQKLGEASPGGAGRNRTLGLKKLEEITVPVPPIEVQRWFDDLQMKAHQIRQLREQSAKDLDALIPAMLHEVFNDSQRVTEAA